MFIVTEYAALTNNADLRSVCNSKSLSYFSFKTYVVGTQKNSLHETVLLSTQNMVKLMGKENITILRFIRLYIWTMVVVLVIYRHCKI